MAHIEKFKASACGAMFHHYERDREGVLERDNIDRERTRLNYVLGQGGGWEEVSRRIESVSKASGKRVRKDAVVMADVVVTRPQNVSEDHQKEFFEACYDYLSEKVGPGNVLGGWVHMDETTPHMHFAFTPILEGRFNYKKLCHRQFYQQLHAEMQAYCKERLGFEPEILLGEDATDKQLSALDQREYIEAKRRLESLQREGEAAERRVAALEVEVDSLRGPDGELALLEARTGGLGGAGERIAGALEECARLRDELDAYRSGHVLGWKGKAGRSLPSVADSGLREQAARARADAARGAVAALGGRLAAARDAVKRWANELKGRVTGWGCWNVTRWTGAVLTSTLHPAMTIEDATDALRRTPVSPVSQRRGGQSIGF